MSHSSGKPSIGDRLKNALLPGHHEHHAAHNSNTTHSKASDAAHAAKHEAQAHHNAKHSSGHQVTHTGQPHSNVTFHAAQDATQLGNAGVATNQNVTGLATTGSSVQTGSTGAVGAQVAENVRRSAQDATNIQHQANTGVQSENAHTLAGKPQTGQSVLVGTGAQGSTGGNTIHHETHTITSSLHGIEAAPQSVVVDSSKLYTDFMPQASHGTGAWLQSLMAKMEAASIDIDRAAKAGQEQISTEAAAEIQRLVAENQLKQKTLISRMQTEARAYEADYNKKREAVIARLDKEQAEVLATLQAKLQSEQAALGVETQQKVEAISELARNKKMTILGEAQQQHASLEKTLTSTTTSVSVAAHPEHMTKHHLLSGAPGGAQKSATETVERTEATTANAGEPRSSVTAGSRN